MLVKTRSNEMLVTKDAGGYWILQLDRVSSLRISPVMVIWREPLRSLFRNEECDITCSMPSLITRRELAGLLAAPAFLRAGRPEIPSPAMAGDVIPGAATVWSRAGLPSRMIVEWRSSERGEGHRIRARTAVQPATSPGASNSPV